MKQASLYLFGKESYKKCWKLANDGKLPIIQSLLPAKWTTKELLDKWLEEEKTIEDEKQKIVKPKKKPEQVVSSGLLGDPSEWGS